MEDIINRILSKTIHVKCKNEQYSVRKFISPELYQIANSYKEKFIRRNRFEGFLSESQAHFYLIGLGLIPFNFKEQLISIDEDIDKLKIDLYKSRYDNNKLDQIRKDMRNLRLKHAQMYLYSESLNHITLEGLATDFMYEFIISKSLERKVKYIDLLKILKVYQNILPNGSQIREACKSNKWRGLWLAKKTDLFDKELDDTQTLAISLSRLYDSVYDCPERPEEFVIQDDDMLDGWLMFKRGESEKEKRRAEVDKGIPTGAQEVYLTAKSKDDIKRINNMNTTDSLAIKHYREQVLKSKQIVRERDFNSGKK